MELFKEKYYQSKDPRKNEILQDLVLERMFYLRDKTYAQVNYNWDVEQRIHELIDKLHEILNSEKDQTKERSTIYKMDEIYESDEDLAEHIENHQNSHDYFQIYSFGNFDTYSLKNLELLSFKSNNGKDLKRYIKRIEREISDQIGNLNPMNNSDAYFLDPLDLSIIEQFKIKISKFNSRMNRQLRQFRIYDDLDQDFLFIDDDIDISRFWFFKSIKVMGVVYPKKLDHLINIICELYQLSSKILVLIDRYIVIKKAKYQYTYDQFGLPELNDDNSEAMTYPDGTAYHYKAGIYYPNWIYDNEKSKFKVKMILAIKNAAIRLEAIREFGIQNFFDLVETRSLDKDRNYELVTIKLGRRRCEYLKMINPTTGEIHFEGVQPGVKTINEALAWRMGIFDHKDPHFEA